MKFKITLYLLLFSSLLIGFSIPYEPYNYKPLVVSYWESLVPLLKGQNQLPWKWYGYAVLVAHIGVLALPLLRKYAWFSKALFYLPLLYLCLAFYAFFTLAVVYNGRPHYFHFIFLFIWIWCRRAYKQELKAGSV